MTEVLEVVADHLDAFNSGDVERVLAGFDEEAVFATGDHLVVGRRGLRALFADAFAGLAPSLSLRSAVVQGEAAACELVERFTVAGVTQEAALAAFYTVRGGRIVRVKVYREGSADAAGARRAGAE